MKKQKKIMLLVVSLVLLLLVSVVGTLAYLADSTGEVVNVFTLSTVPNEITEEIDGNVKNNVRVTNTGNADAYIRACVVVNWVDDAGNVYYEKPVEKTDYTISWMPADEDGEGTRWVLGDDGFYYYQDIVEPGEQTGVLFTECKLIKSATVPEGYFLSVEIMGQSIQARGTDENGNAPVELAWSGDSITVTVNDDGTLSVSPASSSGE